MIPVAPQAEPADFQEKVRVPGQKWLIENRQRDFSGGDMPPYWRACLPQLYDAYHGVCGYLAVYFERACGAASTDHFIAKSGQPELAYEWHNFRLACTAMNAKKHAWDDVLDPFAVLSGWFCLELVSGRIFPDPALDESLRAKVQATIDRLGLDDAIYRTVRVRHLSDFQQGFYVEDYFARISPFVHAQWRRQCGVGQGATSGPQAGTN